MIQPLRSCQATPSKSWLKSIRPPLLISPKSSWQDSIVSPFQLFTDISVSARNCLWLKNVWMNSAGLVCQRKCLRLSSCLLSWRGVIRSLKETISPSGIPANQPCPRPLRKRKKRTVLQDQRRFCWKMMIQMDIDYRLNRITRACKNWILSWKMNSSKRVSNVCRSWLGCMLRFHSHLHSERVPWTLNRWTRIPGLRPLPWRNRIWNESMEWCRDEVARIVLLKKQRVLDLLSRNQRRIFFRKNGGVIFNSPSILAVRRWWKKGSMSMAFISWLMVFSKRVWRPKLPGRIPNRKSISERVFLLLVLAV